MVIFSVKIQKLLISQLWNILRISAGFHSVGRVRKQYIHRLALQKLIRRREYTFHFIVNYTIISQRLIFCLQLITPAFLPKDFFSFINVRKKDCIQIDMHQILKVLLIAACHRIHRFIRKCHRIQKCIQRPLYQLHKRILQRKMLRSAQHAVFQDMCHSRTVRRRRAKGDVENLVLIIILNEHDSRATLFMTKEISF